MLSVKFTARRVGSLKFSLVRADERGMPRRCVLVRAGLVLTLTLLTACSGGSAQDDAGTPATSPQLPTSAVVTSAPPATATDPSGTAPSAGTTNATAESVPATPEAVETALGDADQAVADADQALQDADAALAEADAATG